MKLGVYRFPGILLLVASEKDGRWAKEVRLLQYKHIKLHVRFQSRIVAMQTDCFDIGW